MNISSVLSVARRFDTTSPVEKITPLGEGLINDTFVVTTQSGERYVLQRVNTSIFRDMDVLQNNLKLITDHIRKCLIEAGEIEIERKTLTPILTQSGNLWEKTDDGAAWRMTLFIEDSVTLSHLTPEMAELTGKAFAQFQSYFAREDAPILQETIPDFHNVGLRIKQLREAVQTHPTDRIEKCKKEIDYLLSRAEEMLTAQKRFEEGVLPKRIAHCDTKLSNILFDADGDILCVIDLDTTMPGFVLSDFGDFIRTAANTGAEDDPDLERINVDMDIFRSFARGYLSSARFLTETEIGMLPFSAQMMTYMQAVRFLTDYLNGDTYYKIQYPEHNYIRTLAQMKLLSSIDNHIQEMKDIIKSECSCNF